LTTEALRTAFGAICAPAATRNRETHPTHPANRAHPADPTHPANPAGATDPAERTRTAPTATVDADDPPAPTRTPDDTTAEPSAGDPTDDPTGTGDHPCPTGEEPAGPDEEPPGPDEEPAGPDEEPAGGGCDPSNTPPVWRPSRIPEHWAPLGTVATDYPPPPTPPHPEPPHPEPPPTGQPHPGPPEDRRSRPTRQAHALSIIINKFLELGCAPTQGGERPHLLVTVKPGKTQPMSLVRMALRQAALKVRLALPMSRVSLWPPRTAGMIRASQASMRMWWMGRWSP